MSCVKDPNEFPAISRRQFKLGSTSKRLAALIMTMWPIRAQLKAVARLYLNVGSPPAEGTLGLVGCSVVQGIGLHGGRIPRR